MTVPTYKQLVTAIDRIAAAYHAEPANGTGPDVARTLAEFDSAVNDAQRLVNETRRHPGEVAPVERDPARRLTAPTGEPVQPDPDTPPPTHARSAGRQQSDMVPLA